MIYLITGGAGSLGRAIIEQLHDSEIKDLVVRVFDNNELALANIPDYPCVRTIHGDIRNKEALDTALRNVDFVIHCAAMKNIDITEYNVTSTIDINVNGTNNVCLSAIKNNVNRVVIISSDKAVEPTTLYGSTKQLSEHIAKRHAVTTSHTQFIIFRPVNFLESNGNVFEVWQNQYNNNVPLTITNFKCIRYYMDIKIAATICLTITHVCDNGSIIIPNESCYNAQSVLSLYDKFCEIKNATLQYKIKGLRNNEKLCELTYTSNEQRKNMQLIPCYEIKLEV